MHSETLNGWASWPLRALDAARTSLAVPASCVAERDRLIRARVRAIAPVLAAPTVGWLLLDRLVLPTTDLAAVGLLRVLLAAALLVLSRASHRLSGPGVFRAFVWLQACGYGAIQLLFVPGDAATLDIGYGLFPFFVAAQLALFPMTWLQTLRAAVPAALLLTLVHVAGGHDLDAAGRNDVWLLALLVAVGAWTAQAQLNLLVGFLSARREASHDALTGLANRRNVDARLAAEHARCVRHGDPLSVLMCDIDRFKRVNDTHGHAAGDVVLASVADAIASELRACDLAARYGGEEFLVLLPEASVDDAMHIAERIRARIAVLVVDTGVTRLAVTISIGAAELGAGETVDALLARADAALYRAKADGRDRCVASDPPGSVAAVAKVNA